jgi:hypothetical protein
VMASASASGGGAGPGVIRRMSETTTRDLGLRARRSGQPPPNHGAMPAPTSTPAMNTTAGGLAPRAHGRALAGSAASGIEASPVAAGHEARRRQLTRCGLAARRMVQRSKVSSTRRTQAASICRRPKSTAWNAVGTSSRCQWAWSACVRVCDDAA